MAKILTQEAIDAIHASMETSYPMSRVSLTCLDKYYQGGDYSLYCFNRDATNDFTVEFNICLLILAAEDELDDYPMEAVE